MKKSICQARLFSRRFLNELIDGQSISSWDKLFHRFITLWEKKCRRVSHRQFFFTSFQLCPLVQVSSALWKKRDQEMADNPFTTVIGTVRIVCGAGSMKRYRFRLSVRKNKTLNSCPITLPNVNRFSNFWTARLSSKFAKNSRLNNNNNNKQICIAP